MLRLFITLTLSCLLVSLFGQSNHTVGIHAGTSHSFRTIQLSGDNDDFGNNVLLNKAEDNTRTQLTFGFDYTLGLSKKLSLLTGFTYQNLGYNTPDAFFTYPDENPFVGEITDRENYLTIESFSLPLSLEYNLMNTSKSSLRSGIGVIMTYITHEENYRSFFQNDVQSISIDNYNYEFNPIQVGGRLHLTYEYKLTSNLGINVTPSFNYYFTNNTDNGVTENLYNFRSTLGLSYSFGSKEL